MGILHSFNATHRHQIVTHDNKGLFLWLKLLTPQLTPQKVTITAVPLPSWMHLWWLFYPILNATRISTYQIGMRENASLPRVSPALIEVATHRDVQMTTVFTVGLSCQCLCFAIRLSCQFLCFGICFRTLMQIFVFCCVTFMQIFVFYSWTFMQIFVFYSWTFMQIFVFYSWTFMQIFVFYSWTFMQIFVLISMKQTVGD